MAKINWQLDPAHSEIGFKVRHMMVSNVRGEFQSFDIKMSTEDHDMSTAEIDFTADVHSVNTKVEQRDNHLKSADFFDAENHPKMTFKSTKVTKVAEGEFEVEGNLTIRGITNPVTLKVENHGVVQDPQVGKTRTGFDITGKIKRLDFGLKYNPMLEAGGAVVSNDVKLIANAEFLHD